MKTGPVRFGDNWPELFLRGDDALGFAMYLTVLIDEVKKC